MHYYIGLMSGTSKDGIDAVLVAIDQGIRLIDCYCQKMTEEMKQSLSNFSDPDRTHKLESIGQINISMSKAFSAAAQVLIERHPNIKPYIRAIGSHGHTLWHQPEGEHAFSWQIGDPSHIAHYTGITTVADFRQRDVAARGQGAPLVPEFHRFAFSDPQKSRMIVNIGGIANLSHLPANPDQDLVGYDTGPGNALMDQWMLCNENKPFDAQGAWARQGQVNEEVLQAMLDDAYFSKPSPKSTGLEYFNWHWLLSRLQINGQYLRSVDVQCTLTELTAQSIAREVALYDVDELYVCGGGANNDFLLERMAYCSGLTVQSTEVLGIHPDWVEASAFAWLAYQTLNGQTSNAPSVTGARQACVLGGIYPC